MPGRHVRRTTQQRQELRSRHQLSEAWVDWPQQGTAEDLGEDFIFQIYEDGVSTGLSFYAQVKSTRDLQSLLRGQYVSCRF